MGHRIDYVKFARYLEADRAQQVAAEFYTNFCGEDYAERKALPAKVTSVRHMRGDVYLYVFEAWGEAAMQVFNLSFASWVTDLSRMDIRNDITLSRQGVDRLYGYVRDHKAGNRNIHLFDSKATTKRQGRDSGGYGIALGSHKSAKRHTVYVRGKQGGAIEFQYAGDQCTATARTVADYCLNHLELNNQQRWVTLMDNIASIGLADLYGVTGLQTKEIEAMSLSDALNEQEEENLVANIDALLEKLSPDGLHAINVSLQQRLF